MRLRKEWEARFMWWGAARQSALAQEAGRAVCGKDFLSLSMGAAFYPQDGLDAEQLLAEADKRMYAVRLLHYEGRGRVVPGLIPRPFLVSAS